jgi:hypothetical protein
MKTTLKYIRSYERRCMTAGEAVTVFISNVISGVFFLLGAWFLWRALLLSMAIYELAHTSDGAGIGDAIGIVAVGAFAAGFMVTSAACQIISQTVRNRAAIRASIMIAEDSAQKNAPAGAFPVVSE